jgi:hypothetical protein
MEQTLTFFRSNFRCHVLVISGKADEGPKNKKKREVMSGLERVEGLVKLTRGMRIAAVRCHYGVNDQGKHSQNRWHSLITTTSRTCSDR